MESLYRQMYNGMIQKDGGLLEEIPDDSFVLVHMTGMRQSKEEYICAILDGTLNYFSAGHQRLETDIRGNTASPLNMEKVRPR